MESEIKAWLKANYKITNSGDSYYLNGKSIFPKDENSIWLAGFKRWGKKMISKRALIALIYNK